LKPYRLYILDLDGTLYRGTEPVVHAVETVRALRSRGALIRFLTNNSGETRQFYVEKLSAMGYGAQPEEVYSTAIGAAEYCLEQKLGSVFAVGEPGLLATLADAGVHVANLGPQGFPSPGSESGPAVDAVVVGVCRTLTYALIEAAMQHLLGGARFIATNTDNSYPLEGGRLQPGAGSMVAAIATCSNRHPEIVIGKPNPLMVWQIARAAGVELSDVLCVGDRLETDILSGKNAGCDTHLVLTGVTPSAPEGQSSSPDLRGLL
jgi:4-nitrophenyl phosphatase